MKFHYFSNMLIPQESPIYLRFLVTLLLHKQYTFHINFMNHTFWSIQ